MEELVTLSLLLPVFGRQEVRGIFHCSENLFLDSGNTLFCLLMMRPSSHWRLHTDAAISSATLLLLSHKQE